MKERTYKIFIEDIVEAMNKIERYIKDRSYEEFVKNDMIVDAVIRNLEIIGEASKSVPKSVREQHAKIPWRRMIGLRNIVIHEYFGVDLSIIWEIITKNIPKTKPMLEEILEGNKGK